MQNSNSMEPSPEKTMWNYTLRAFPWHDLKQMIWLNDMLKGQPRSRRFQRACHRRKWLCSQAFQGVIIVNFCPKEVTPTSKHPFEYSSDFCQNQYLSIEPHTGAHSSSQWFNLNRLLKRPHWLTGAKAIWDLATTAKATSRAMLIVLLLVETMSVVLNESNTQASLLL